MFKVTWQRSLLGGVLAAMLLATVLFVSPFVQPVRHDWNLDGEVLGVAMDWRDFDVDKAKERLDFEIQRQGMVPWVSKDDCQFVVENKSDRVVRCRWDVDVLIPVVGARVPMQFESQAVIRSDGEISTW